MYLNKSYIYIYIFRRLLLMLHFMTLHFWRCCNMYSESRTTAIFVLLWYNIKKNEFKVTSKGTIFVKS